MGARPDLGAYELGTATSTPSTSQLPTTSPTTATNLVVNPGFEQQGTGWEDWGNVMIDTSTKSSGTFSLRVGPGEGGRGQVVPIKPNVAYVLTASARVGTTVDESCYVGISYRDAAGAKIGGPSIHVTSTSWATTSLDFVAVSSMASAKVWVWKNAGSSHCWVDDFRLVAK